MDTFATASKQNITPTNRQATHDTKLLRRPVNDIERLSRFVSTAQPKASATELGITSKSGKRMYRTSNGEMVDLPADMTAEEAAKLEAEAKVAEKKLGQRPQPKPVPDVKKLVSKEAPKEKPKPEVKAKKDGKGKSKVAPKAGGAATALVEAVGHSKVAKYLAKRGAPILFKGMGKLQKLKQNEQTHDNAVEKLKQTEKAVVIPPGEGQSQSNAGQVNTVSAKSPQLMKTKPGRSCRNRSKKISRKP